MSEKQAILPPLVPRRMSFSDSFAMNKNPIRIFAKYTEQFGDTYSFHFGGVKKAFVTSSPEIIQYILQKNYGNYKKSEIQTKRMGHFLGDGLLTSHGKRWLTQRRIIQEGFHKDRLSSLFQNMDEVCIKSVDNLDTESLDVTTFMREMTFRMVMKTLYSNSLTENDLKKIGSHISSVQQFILRQIVQPYLNPWFKISGIQRKYEKKREETDRIISEIIHERKKKQETHSDMLQTLMDARYPETGLGMPDDQILIESMHLIVAAHETSSTALSWILYLLTQNPDCFQKVKEEIHSHISPASVTIQDLSKLEYTVQVIEESLRIYPPFWMIDRVSIEKDEVMGYSIPKDTMVLVFIHGVHHCPKYWSDPEVFNPDRFGKEKIKGHLPFTHIPFGGGPRVCIGGNYAMLQMLTILARLISKYEISLVEKNPVEIKPLLILRPKGKIKMHFKPIR